MKDFRATFSNEISTCLFFIRAAYEYTMAIIETILSLLLVYCFVSASSFLYITSWISIVAGASSVMLSIFTLYMENKVSGNSFFGYITPIVFAILGSAFFTCILTGNIFYACYIGIILQSAVRPLRYTLNNIFVNSTWAASSDDIKSLQGFNSAFGSMPSKWFAALMMIFFVVTTSASGNMLVLATSVAIATAIWLVSVYCTPKITKIKFDERVFGEKETSESEENKKNKYWYWSIIATLAIGCVTLLQILKNTINAKLIGPALLPSIRLWVYLPSVIAFYAVVSILKACYPENNEYFSIALMLFGAVFIVFAALFPYGAILQEFTIASFVPNTAAMMLQNWFPITFSMLCEMWAVIITGTIVYPLQNEYFDADEIFTVIPKIVILQSMGEIVAGFVMSIISSYNLPINTIVILVVLAVVASIILMIGCHKSMYASCIKPKYLFQKQMERVKKSRYTCRNNLLGVLCFGAGVAAMYYSFTICAVALMTLAAIGFMFEKITLVCQQFNSSLDTYVKSNEFKPKLGIFNKDINHLSLTAAGCNICQIS